MALENSGTPKKTTEPVSEQALTVSALIIAPALAVVAETLDKIAGNLSLAE